MDGPPRCNDPLLKMREAEKELLDQMESIQKKQDKEFEEQVRIERSRRDGNRYECCKCPLAAYWTRPEAHDEPRCYALRHDRPYRCPDCGSDMVGRKVRIVPVVKHECEKCHYKVVGQSLSLLAVCPCTLVCDGDEKGKGKEE